MNIMEKLATAFRGSVRETAEIVIDANSLRIFAQEIHECEAHISESKQQLASIIAEKMHVQRKLQQSEETIKQYEQRIAQCLQENKETEAVHLAQVTAEKEPMRDKQKQHYQQLVAHEKRLQKTLKTMVNKLDHYRSELRMAQANAKLQSAQTKLSKHEGNAVSRFGSMEDSLSRIQQRQQLFADEMEAMEQVNHYLAEDIEGDTTRTAKLAAQDVLNRVKQQNTPEKSKNPEE